MRTFVAVEVENEDAISNMVNFQRELMSSGLNAKPVGSDQLHFTVMFLGEIGPTMLESVKGALADITFDPFDINLVGLGVFPKPSFPRIIWIGVDKDSAEKLIALAKEVENRLGPLGFRNHRAFKPHITLFRVKNKLRDIDLVMQQKDKQFGSDKVKNVKLKKSELTPKGPIYTDLLSVGNN